MIIEKRQSECYKKIDFRVSVYITSQRRKSTKRRLAAFVIAGLFLLSVIPFGVFASDAVELEANTVAVSATLTGANGSEAQVEIGDVTYRVTVGETGFSTVQAALDAVPTGGRFCLRRAPIPKV